MGISGKIAGAFLHSKLTPLIAATSLALGGLALIATAFVQEFVPFFSLAGDAREKGAGQETNEVVQRVAVIRR